MKNNNNIYAGTLSPDNMKEYTLILDDCELKKLIGALLLEPCDDFTIHQYFWPHRNLLRGIAQQLKLQLETPHLWREEKM